MLSFHPFIWGRKVIFPFTKSWLEK
jgi:hypothetical protein